MSTNNIEAIIENESIEVLKEEIKECTREVINETNIESDSDESIYSDSSSDEEEKGEKETEVRESNGVDEMDEIDEVDKFLNQMQGQQHIHWNNVYDLNQMILQTMHIEDPHQRKERLLHLQHAVNILVNRLKDEELSVPKVEESNKEVESDEEADEEINTQQVELSDEQLAAIIEISEGRVPDCTPEFLEQTLNMASQGIIDEALEARLPQPNDEPVNEPNGESKELEAEIPQPGDDKKVEDSSSMCITM